MKEQINVFSQNSILLNGSVKIYIDPFHIPNETHDADYIFITHPHWDHFSILDILRIKKQETNFFIPKEVFEELLDMGIDESQIKVVKPNEQYSFDKMKFQTVPAYNIKSNYHPKENLWCGYLITLDQITYYIAGDTDVIKDNWDISADVIFLPVGGTYTMDERDAARFANQIKPKIAIPTHYGVACGSIENAKKFKKYVAKEIAVKIFYESDNTNERRD